MSVLAPLQAAPARSKAATTHAASTALQRKVALGTSNDPLEREADQIADQVLAAPEHGPVINVVAQNQRFSKQPENKVGMASVSAGHAVLGSGKPLDAPLRTDMEQRFGHDLRCGIIWIINYQYSLGLRHKLV